MRGKLLIVLLGIALAGCRGEHASDAPRAITGDRIATTRAVNLADAANAVDTLSVNEAASEVAWAGTKMWGRGGHTGIVPVESGWIAVDEGRLVAGHVVVDMTEIGITDIPPDQPEPIELLTRHLEDPLFFHVGRYPTASFRLLGSERVDGNLLLADGLLTIRGVTRSVRIPVEVIQPGSIYRSQFRIDRFDWNVAYDGGFGATRFAARNFVDRDIELDIRLELNK